MAPDLQGLASLIVAQQDLLPSFLSFPGMLWLLLGILDHSGHEVAVSISFVCLCGRSSFTVAACGEGQGMLMGHLAASVPAWLTVENKIELMEGENAILTECRNRPKLGLPVSLVPDRYNYRYYFTRDNEGVVGNYRVHHQTHSLLSTSFVTYKLDFECVE